MEQKIWFKNSKKSRLCGLLNLQNNSETSPTIILVHGMMPRTDKHEYGFFDFVSGELYKNGYNTFRFDFFAHGESEGNYVDLRVEQEVDDLKHAIDFIFTQKIDKGRVGILSTSFGSVSVVLLNDKRIKAIQLTSPFTKITGRNVHVFDKYLGENWREEFEKYGYATIKYLTPKEERKQKIGKAIWDDIKSLNITEEIKKVKIPVFILGGGKDRYVEPEYLKILFNSTNEPKFLKIIEWADHNLKDSEKEKEVFITETLKFFNKWLK